MTRADKPKARQGGMCAKLQLMNITTETDKTTWVSMGYMGESLRNKNCLLKGPEDSCLENLTMLSCLVKTQEVQATFPSDGQHAALDVHSAWYDFTHLHRV